MKFFLKKIGPRYCFWNFLKWDSEIVFGTPIILWDTNNVFWTPIFSWDHNTATEPKVLEGETELTMEK